ncbi:hypothetical protein EAI_02289 [Harpegnathos saltator]|uniref:Uncharacterized protein n=1 Tax=Harpegnathos saltator TaxID=610380 RepID=E2BZI3_HARSA|nr:hypothetical protein EAI_02289 [Harpegnathos saltator]
MARVYEIPLRGSIENEPGLRLCRLNGSHTGLTGLGTKRRIHAEIDSATISRIQAPAQSMQPTARGNPRLPSPGPLRPFTPPDLSSIPHMDGTPLHNSNDSNGNNNNNNNNNNNAHNSGASPASNRANDGAQEPTGPFIIGSPIDLGDIDNVDNIGLRLDPAVRGRRRTREHIELRETDLPESTSEGRAAVVALRCSWSVLTPTCCRCWAHAFSRQHVNTPDAFVKSTLDQCRMNLVSHKSWMIRRTRRYQDVVGYEPTQELATKWANSNLDDSILTSLHCCCIDISAGKDARRQRNDNTVEKVPS